MSVAIFAMMRRCVAVSAELAKAKRVSSTAPAGGGVGSNISASYSMSAYSSSCSPLMRWAPFRRARVLAAAGPFHAIEPDPAAGAAHSSDAHPGHAWHCPTPPRLDRGTGPASVAGAALYPEGLEQRGPPAGKHEVRHGLAGAGCQRDAEHRVPGRDEEVRKGRHAIQDGQAVRGVLG